MTKQNEEELSALTRQVLHMGGLVEQALELADMLVLRRGNRLSITPVTAPQWRFITGKLLGIPGARHLPHQSRPG